jgi:hypothetical protein
MAVAVRLDTQDDMSFVSRGTRHIAQRLVPTQAHRQYRAGPHALEAELGSDEGHGADLAGNVDVIVGLYGHVQLYPDRLPV